MTDRFDGEKWLTERSGLTALVAVSVVLGLLVILPYLQYVLFGVILAYILTPAQRWLERYVSSMTAALTLVVVAVLAILLPLAYVLTLALREALTIVTAAQNGNINVAAIESRIEATGYSVDLADLYQTYQGPITTGVQRFARTAVEFATGVPALLIGLTVTLFVLFALLRDGEQLVAWFRHVLPIEDEIQRELCAELDQLMWASVVGNVAVAGVQAVLLGFGLAVLDLPSAVFLTVATFVLALLPLVGAFGVWVPVTVYLLAVNRPVAAAVLVVYGSLVSASDTYLRPALIGRTSAFNSAIIVVGIFGGLVVFGAVGLFIGPVVLGGAKITLDVFARERTGADELPGANEPAAAPSVDTDDETGIRKTADTEAGSDDGALDSDRDLGTEADRENGSDPERGAETRPDRRTHVDGDVDSP